MKQLILPSRVELAILAAWAVLAAVFLSTMTGSDLAVVVLAFPTILVALFMGARRSGHLAPARQPIGSAEQPA
jgi:hypothetical protein